MSILTMHHGLMAGIKQGDPPGYVTIGQNLYPYVKIGNLIWTARNLREPIGTVNSDYKEYDGTSIGFPDYTEKYGLYYRPDSLLNADGTPKSILASIIPSGWRVPTLSDFNSLMSVVGTQASKYSIPEKFPNGGLYNGTSMIGTNDYGFNADATGYMYNNSISSIFNYSQYMSSSYQYESYLNHLWIYPDNGTQVFIQGGNSNFTKMSLRLVKDVT